jgi:trigger factor
MHIEIPQDEVVRELDNAYKQLKKNAKIKGFRPGKAPRSVLERMYRKDVHADVSSKLIQTSFTDALKETELKIVGYPKVDPPEMEATAPYRYSATVEVAPVIDDIDYKGMALERTKYEISDDEINAQLGMLQKNMAQMNPIKEDRGLQKGDFALIDYEGFQDGKPFEAAALTKDFTLKIGDGVILPEFDDQLIGLKAGGVKEFNIAFPEDYFNQQLANQTVDFKVTLNDIREEILPEIDDELAKKVGQYETIDDLKEAMTANLKQGYDKRVEQELNEQVFSNLLEKASFEVPETLVEAELESIIQEAERSFANRNTSLEEQGMSRESISEKYRDTAIKQVQRYLLLNKIIEQESLAVTDDEFDEALSEMASNFNQPLEEVKKYYQQFPDRIDQFKHALLEKKAITLIIESSQIEDIAPKPAGESTAEAAKT